MSELAAGTEDSLPTPVRKRRSKKRLMIALVIIVMVMIGSAFYIFNRLNGNSTGIITNPSTAQQNAGLSFNFNPVGVQGTYITFAYPAAFQVNSIQQKPINPILEAYSYKYSDIQTWILAISVTRLASNSLTADSGYHARTLNPSEYRQSTIVVGKKSYIVMTDTSAVGFNEVAYSLHNGMSADISLLGNDSLGTADLQATFSNVLASFNWR